MEKHHDLQLTFPCWVLAEAANDDLQQASNVVIMQSPQKQVLEVYLDKVEAVRTIDESKMTGRIPLTIPSIENLSQLTEHLQTRGVHEVHVFLPVQGDQVTRAAMTIGDFNAGLRKHLAGG